MKAAGKQEENDMATRAVYTWKRPNYEAYHVYNHWDGYPHGAAELLRDCKTPEDFIRKNDKSMLTVSPDAHGDLSYWYEISVTGYGAWVSCWTRDCTTGRKSEGFVDKPFDEFVEPQDTTVN